MAEKGNQRQLKAGARLVPVLILLLGAGSLPEAIKLYRNDPAVNGSGIFPIVISLIMVVLSILEILKERKSSSEITGLPLKQKLAKVVDYLIPKNVFFMLVVVVLYCVALGIGIGFEISTTLFLLISMIFYIPKKLPKNIAYTAITMVSLVVIFKIVFSVVLP